MGNDTADRINDPEDGYRLLFERLPESMLVFDTAGRIARFNEAAHLHLGYSRDEFARIGIREIDPFETEDGMRAKLRKIMDEGFAEFDVKQRRKDGDLRDVHVVSQMIPWGGRRAINSIWRDVTPINNSLKTLRSELEQAREQRARAEEIVASIGEAVSVQDTGFRILYQNRMSRQRVGAHEGEYCYAAYERGDRVCDGCPVMMSFGDGKPHTAVRGLRTGRGISYFEITASVLKDPAGRVAAGIEVVRDVTQKKQAEEELCRRIDALGSAPGELIAAVKKVYESAGYMGLSLARPFDREYETHAPDRILPHEILSARELQVLRMIASGKTTKRIAEELSLSGKTISTFRGRILKKMRLTNNAQLAQYAMRTGLID